MSKRFKANPVWDCAALLGVAVIPLLVQVLESWRVILRGMPMDITLENVRVCARDGAAFVTCTEIMEAGDGRGRCPPAPAPPCTCLPVRACHDLTAQGLCRRSKARLALHDREGNPSLYTVSLCRSPCVQRTCPHIVMGGSLATVPCDDEVVLDAGPSPPMCLRGRVASG